VEFELHQTKADSPSRHRNGKKLSTVRQVLRLFSHVVSISANYGAGTSLAVKISWP